MDKREALERLIEAVEAGNAFLPDFRNAFQETRSPAFKIHEQYMQCHHVASAAYNGSLDAAKALHKALLPGWGYWVGPIHARLVHSSDASLAQHGEGENPARAWLLAILRAKLAEAGE